MKTAEYRSTVAASMSESDLQDQVITLARTFGWLVYHTHDSRRSQPGFPDLVMARHGRVIFAELKTMRGRVSPAQVEWLDSLGLNHDNVWRPSALMSGEIARVLR